MIRSMHKIYMHVTYGIKIYPHSIKLRCIIPKQQHRGCAWYMYQPAFHMNLGDREPHGKDCAPVASRHLFALNMNFS